MIMARYFLVVGGFFYLFYKSKNSSREWKKVNTRSHKPGQYLREVKWSTGTTIVFSVTGSLVGIAWQKGYTAMYEDVWDYGVTYFIGSIVIMAILHETYFYWTHRLMHHPRLFKVIHKVHHESVVTSPWAAFSFHPLESIIEALILPVLLFVVPVHPYAFIVYLTIMTISSVINHLNIEIYPAGFEKHWLGRWLIGATHHGLHHSQFNYNFGLYFTFWDKWCGTESPGYLRLADEIGKRKQREDRRATSPVIIKKSGE